MALETLKGISIIDGFGVMSERPKDADGKVDWAKFDALRKVDPIYVDHDVNMISFRIQRGPVKEVGVNGCQVGTIIEAAFHIIFGLNKQFPSPYNQDALNHLGRAMSSLKTRTRDREARCVEGQSKL